MIGPSDDSRLDAHPGQARRRSTQGTEHLRMARPFDQQGRRGCGCLAARRGHRCAREHYHKRSTELYYVLDGDGTVVLDGVEHPVRKGSLVHIPPGTVHGAKGRMRVLVIGIPDIADDDLYYPQIDTRPAEHRTAQSGASKS